MQRQQSKLSNNPSSPSLRPDASKKSLQHSPSKKTVVTGDRESIAESDYEQISARSNVSFVAKTLDYQMEPAIGKDYLNMSSARKETMANKQFLKDIDKWFKKVNEHSCAKSIQNIRQ